MRYLNLENMQLNQFLRAARRSLLITTTATLLAIPAVDASAQVSNLSVRAMAANISSGSFQSYETEGINILKGLKPDIVAIQEFKAFTGSSGSTNLVDIQNLVSNAFGTNFYFYKEVAAGYSIPNGIISRWPFVTNGSWVDSDTGVNDRGFAWARIDLPGTNDLYVVSVHLKASNTSGPPSDASRRAAQAAELKNRITTSFPANAWIIVAGDMNLYTESEGAIITFKTFLSDSPVPADQNGGTNTNAGRSERYDRVLPGFSLTNMIVPVVLPSHTFNNGLVFDSRVYTPLSDVPPVVSGDSGVSGMQHMAVVKNFLLPVYVASGPPAIAPTLSTPGLAGNQFIFQLTGTATSNYVVQVSTNLALSNWLSLQTNAAPFWFTNPIAQPQQFYRGTVAP